MTDVDVSSTGRRSPFRAPQPALPIVAVAGLRGKSTIAWLLDDILTRAGLATGLWCSTGVYIRGERQSGELGPWSRVLGATQRGVLDLAIQELETPLVTGVGLPQHIYPFAAVSTLCGNNEDCLVSPEASQGAAALTIVARAVRPDGIMVLNADDLAVLSAAERTEAQVVLFALHPDNPALRRHLDAGGNAVWLDNGNIVVGDRLDHRVILHVADAHFTLDGALTFQVQNLLCAVALAVALDVPDATIRAAIPAFDPDPVRLPGSCNIIQVNGSTVVVDAARQVWTLRSLIRGIRHQPHRRTIIVSNCFAHLPEAQIIDAGRLLGRLGGAVVLHASDADRSRADLLMDGIAQNEIPPLVLVMPNEREAIAHAARMLGASDLCLLVTEDVAEALAVVEQQRS